MASIDHLHEESLTLRVKDHSDMLSAQYLVNCLEKDHVCHGITTQEPRPRPMKETLHSSHHSTVLPRLGSSRMESHQNLHTHAVESAIQLQGNNRVLKKPKSLFQHTQAGGSTYPHPRVRWTNKILIFNLSFLQHCLIHPDLVWHKSIVFVYSVSLWIHFPLTEINDLMRANHFF